MVREAQARRNLRGHETRYLVRYSSKIIKAGAILADTKTLLVNWDTAAPAQVNLDRLRRENVLGKVSRSRVEDVLAIFRQRFLSEESVTKALVALARARLRIVFGFDGRETLAFLFSEISLGAHAGLQVHYLMARGDGCLAALRV
jgi:hypothetical protein